MELGRRITELRKANNLTQEGLAERCSVTRQTISNWETGKSYPDLEMLVFISDSLALHEFLWDSYLKLSHIFN